MYSQILVAVDGSPTSEHALRHAIGLAKGLSAALPLAPELAIDIGAITKARRAAGEHILTMARETCRTAGIEAETLLVETATPAQRIAAAIADEAAAWPADLVVAGTHGRTGVQRILCAWCVGKRPRLKKILPRRDSIRPDCTTPDKATSPPFCNTPVLQSMTRNSHTQQPRRARLQRSWPG